MRTLLGPALLAIVSYLVGGCVRRLLLGRGPTAGIAEHRLFEELLIGVLLISWVGMLLAEFGFFRIAPLLGACAAVSGLALLAHRAPPRRYDRSDALGLLIALVAVVWVTPPFDTLLYGSDSSVYQAGGIHLARTGGLEFNDPTIAALTPTEQAWLLPSQASDTVSPPYLRLAGGFTLADRTAPSVLPAFHHLFMVWTGLSVLFGGVSAAPWAATFFTALAPWALYRFTATIARNQLAAIVTVALLGATAPQYWYGRFPMPEVATQFLIWGALASFVTWQCGQSIRDAVLAAAGLGVAGIMRADQFPLLALPVLWAAARSAPLPRRQWIAFAATLGALWLHAVLHLATFRTHYYSFARNLMVDGWHHLGNRGLPVAFGVLLTALVLLLWARPRGCRPILFAVAMVATVSDVALLIGRGEWNAETNIGYLITYCGVPMLVAAIAGALALRRTSSPRLFWYTLIIAATHALLDPHAQPVPLWVARRFVPVLLPGIAFLAGIALTNVYATGHRITGCIAMLACIAAPALHTLPLATHSLYPTAAPHVEAVAALLPAGAVVVAEKTTSLTTQFLPALWSIGGIPPYLIEPDRRADVAHLVLSLSPRPVFWLTVSQQPPAPVPGLLIVPVASYSFAFPVANFERYREKVAVVGGETMRIGLYRLLLDPNARRAE
ncbi:MAG: hypothetical protein HYR72_01900 [Deltaproteobacteria bacterium]|nr:hypothetical protein [Deltaproteobacteria bacterium]MBI3390809.1 hypothetical protein [Deltaproteobacteria bacterium]